MRKLVYFIKNAVYFLIMAVIGLYLIDGEPFAFFIFGFWTLLISFSLFKNNVLLLRILVPDFKMITHNKTKSIRLKQIKIVLALSFILFSLGVVEIFI